MVLYSKLTTLNGVVRKKLSMSQSHHLKGTSHLRVRNSSAKTVAKGQNILLGILIVLCLCTMKGGNRPGYNPLSELETLQLSQTNKLTNSITVQTREEEQTALKIGKDHVLPKWITEYLDWHNEMREKFPGKAILEDPNAPKVLIRTCFGLCGGLNDRLGQLPTDIYAAKITNRILLINWQKPHPLEAFLEPTPQGIDWRYPIDGVKLVRSDFKETREISNIGDARKSITSFVDWFDENIQELNEGKWKNERVVIWSVAHDYRKNKFDERFRNLGDPDTVYGTTSFGLLWHTMLRPVKRLRKKIDQVSKEMGLKAGKYSAVHCRVRHPRAFKRGTKTEDGKYVAAADKKSLPFEGIFKETAVNTATHALQCASKIEKSFRSEPVYFMSDSEDLVQFLAHDMTSNEYLKTHSDLVFQDETIENKAFKATSKLEMRARDTSIPNLHIDKQKGKRVPLYYPTFIDLYLGINARCVALGIGNYALFAAQISGTDCVIRYAMEKWSGEHKGNVKNNMICTKTDINSSSAAK